MSLPAGAKAVWVRFAVSFAVPLAVALVVPLVVLLGCGGRPLLSDPFFEEPHWRFTDVAEQGDARRRASNRLVAEALSNAVADTPRAIERIRRALQVDATNPWAYLALAREQVAHGEYGAAWSALDQAEARARGEGEIPLVVKAHLSGLRGRVLIARDDSDRAFPLLTEAERLAPSLWSDQHLNAAELR